MKAGFLRRVSSGRAAQLRFYALPKEDEEVADSTRVAKASAHLRPSPRGENMMAMVPPRQQPIKLPLRTTQQAKNKKRGLLQRFTRSRKKAAHEAPKALQKQESRPVKHDDLSEKQIFTPITLSETDSDVEVILPATPHNSSCSVTTQTMEISDFSGSASEQIRQRRTSPLKRTSSDKVVPSSRKRMLLSTSAMSRSARLARRTGNESIGESKPNQPRRGLLPPLLDADEESSCSGITMDFTYEDLKPPVRQLQPTGRLGEGAFPLHNKSAKSFIPPVYITMTESEDIEFDLEW